MKNCDKYQPMIVDSLFGDINDEDAEKLQGHLRSCTECAATAAEMKVTLGLANQREAIAEPSEEFWNNYYARLSIRMKQERVSTKKTSFIKQLMDSFESYQKPVYRFAGVLAILLVGILIGRFWFVQAPEHPQITEDKIPEKNGVQYNLVKNRAEKYVEKSRILLLNIVNAEPNENGEIDVSTERTYARRLLRETAFLKENLDYEKSARLQFLVEELEIILLEIANLEVEQDLPEVEIIQQGIEQKSLLMKINIHKMSEQSETTPASSL